MSDMPIVIRKEYLMLMDGDHCAAAILNAFEMWSKNKPTFIYKSMPEMQADLMGLFGLNRIGEAFKKLRERGFLVARNNPAMAADRTLQYQFQPVVILQTALRRMLTSLKPHALVLMLQALILKYQALGLNDESESISETKSEFKSEIDSKISQRERDAYFEGVDQAKFEKDDPYTPTEPVPVYLQKQNPSRETRQMLAAYSTQLGDRYGQVMTRCANARSWEYVLKAMANEAQSPSSAAPLSQFDWVEYAKTLNGNRKWEDYPGSTDITEHDLSSSDALADEAVQA